MNASAILKVCSHCVILCECDGDFLMRSWETVHMVQLPFISFVSITHGNRTEWVWNHVRHRTHMYHSLWFKAVCSHSVTAIHIFCINHKSQLRRMGVKHIHVRCYTHKFY